MKTHTLRSVSLSLFAAALLLGGCRPPTLAREQDREARHLLTVLATTDKRTLPALYVSGSAELRQFQTLPDFTRTVGQFRQRVGRLQSVTQTDARVTRSMSAEKTNLIYHVTGDQGQTDIKVYLTRQKGQWVLDGLRLGDLP